MATGANLAMTGISYTSAMSTIVGQRASISAMWKRVDDLLKAAASSGRKLSVAPKDDPVAKGTKLNPLQPFSILNGIQKALISYNTLT